MSILLDGTSVIVPVTMLEEKFPGGMIGFAATFANGSFRDDGRIAAVSYLDVADAACVAGELIHRELDPGEVCATDFCLVDNGGRPWLPCLWLDIEENGDGLLVASLAGSLPEAAQESVMVPGYFNPDEPEANLGALNHLSSRQLRRRLEVKGMDGHAMVLRDRKTGTTMKAGIPIRRH